MAAPKTVAEARKAMQKARLKKKGDKDYPAFYAGLPVQKVKAEANEKHAAARKASRDANEVLAIAEITGEGLEDAKHNAAVAALVAEKATPARAATAAGLGGNS